MIDPIEDYIEYLKNIKKYYHPELVKNHCIL